MAGKVTGKILGADIACFCTMIQNSAPAAAGAQQQHRLPRVQGSGFPVLGARAAADVKAAGADIHADGCPLHNGDVIGMAITKPALVVFHLPPIPAAGVEGKVAALLQGSRCGGSRGRLGANIQGAAGSRHCAGFYIGCGLRAGCQNNQQ